MWGRRGWGWGCGEGGREEEAEEGGNESYYCSFRVDMRCINHCVHIGDGDDGSGDDGDGGGVTTG